MYSGFGETPMEGIETTCSRAWCFVRGGVTIPRAHLEKGDGGSSGIAGFRLGVGDELRKLAFGHPEHCFRDAVRISSSWAAVFPNPAIVGSQTALRPAQNR